MAIIKVAKGGRSLKNAMNYLDKDKENEVKELYSGKDCSDNIEQALKGMKNTKELFDKEDGRQYKHYIQSFAPNEVTPEKAHKVGQEWAENCFKGYEVYIATHTDRDHIHNHFVVNSVSFEDGKKIQISKEDLKEFKKENDRICEREGLSVLQPNKNRYIEMSELQTAERGESWKFKLMSEIDYARSISSTKDDFIGNMNERGYEVNWTDTRKNITYTTPEGMKCRDSRLPAEYSKEVMENEFRGSQNQEQTAGLTEGKQQPIDWGAVEHALEDEGARISEQPSSEISGDIQQQIRTVEERVQRATGEYIEDTGNNGNIEREIGQEHEGVNRESAKQYQDRDEELELTMF